MRIRKVMAFALLLCTACSNEIAVLPDDDTSSSDTDISRIYVSGGGSDGLTAGTKGYVGPGDGDEPTDGTSPDVYGTCTADRIDAFVYSVTKGFTSSYPAYTEYAYEQTVDSASLTVQGTDRWTEMSVTSIKTGGTYKYHLAAALAYTAADAAKFTTTLTGTNRTSSTLSIAGDDNPQTPELYFGILRGNGVNQNDNDKDCFWWKNSSDETKIIPLMGRIYRIVGQLKLTITDIPTDNVSKLELYMDNYPTRIVLYGNSVGSDTPHGYYYPIGSVNNYTLSSASAALSAYASAAKLLDSSTDFADGTVTLSSFLLPSEIGGHLTLKVTYVSGETEDFSIRPATSYFITGQDAAVYNVYDSNLKSGSDLYVYDGRKDKYCFYSYSNLRVKISGKFENIATESDESDIVIEIEPNFEKEHDFDII